MENNNGNNNTTRSNNNNNPNSSSSDSDKGRRRDSQREDSDDDESEILEESPCGRYHKRREQVENRVIPGIDATFLAMDAEEGVEVVWNEVNLVNWCESSESQAKEEKIKGALDQLMQLNHPNIVKLLKHWMDRRDGKARVIFITEYMSSGSLRHYLKKMKRNVVRMSLPGWKRWCTQLLSALCYMHCSRPVIIHGNLSSDTICISHTGLIKVDAVTPSAIQRALRWPRNDPPGYQHFVAPEIAPRTEEVAPFPPPLSAAVDIFSFGICALEMAALEIPVDPETGQVTRTQVLSTIKSLENQLQRDFIQACIHERSWCRPEARKLLFHPILFEVPSLRLLSAHVITSSPGYQPEQLTEEVLQNLLNQNHGDDVLAEVRLPNGEVKKFSRCDAPKREVEKFLEEVRNGAYPLTALRPTYRNPVVSKHRNSPELSESPETFDEESRRIVSIECELTNCHSNTACSGLAFTIRLDDHMNRHVKCDHNPAEIFSPVKLVEEMAHYGLIHRDDRDIVKDAINRVLVANKLI